MEKEIKKLLETEGTEVTIIKKFTPHTFKFEITGVAYPDNYSPEARNWEEICERYDLTIEDFNCPVLIDGLLGFSSKLVPNNRDKKIVKIIVLLTKKEMNVTVEEFKKLQMDYINSYSKKTK